MSLYIQGMSSCAVQEIVNLGTHANVEEAMVRFCKQTIGTTHCGLWNGSSGKVKSVDGVANKGCYAVGLGETYIFHGPIRKWTDSLITAPEFADYIKKEELGEVAEGKAVINRRYHPDHKCQVFIWNPDVKALEKWWKKHEGASNEEPKSVITQMEAAAAAPQAANNNEIPF